MSAPTYDLGTLHGGLRLPAKKSASTSRPIIDVPVPSQLVLPITQHVGDPAQPIVGIGERVLKGQLIAAVDGTLGAPVHASSSGTVVAIEPWPVSRRNGDNAPCIVIECDGEMICVSYTGAIGKLLGCLSQYPVERIATRQAGLEQAFIQYYSEQAKAEVSQ